MTATFRRMRAYTLVEMMVALLLSSMIILSVGHWYIDANRSYALSSGRESVTHGARLALELIRKSVEKAGYRAINTEDLGAVLAVDQVFEQGGALPWHLAQVIGGHQLLEGGVNGLSASTVDSESDAIVVRYEAFDRLTPAGWQPAINCSGNPLEAGNVVTDIYYIRRTRDSHGLACLSLRGEGHYDRPSMMVEGVSHLKVLFGESVDEIGSIQYSLERDVHDWRAVRSIRVAMIVGSPNPIPGATRDSIEWALFDASQAIEIPNDNRLSHAFFQTYFLKSIDSK